MKIYVLHVFYAYFNENERFTCIFIENQHLRRSQDSSSKGGGASKKDFSDSLVMAVMKKIDQMRPCEKYVFSMKINVLDIFYTYSAFSTLLEWRGGPDPPLALPFPQFITASLEASEAARKGRRALAASRQVPQRAVEVQTLI